MNLRMNVPNRPIRSSRLSSTKDLALAEGQAYLHLVWVILREYDATSQSLPLQMRTPAVTPWFHIF
jgi:hypothetical protein